MNRTACIRWFVAGQRKPSRPAGARHLRGGPRVFLDATPNLTASRFRSEDLRSAKKTWAAIFKTYDPAWLAAPVGPLAKHWTSTGDPSAFFVMHVGQALSAVRHNLTEKSVPSFDERVRGLLRSNSEAAFQTSLAEFEVAAAFSEFVGPISFDPLVRKEELAAPDRPRSPDFAIRLPDGDVMIEVTVMTPSFLAEWEKAKAAVAHAIRRYVNKSGLRRAVEVRLPWTATPTEAVSLVTPRVLHAMRSQEEGRVSRWLGGWPASLRWSDLPILSGYPAGRSTRLNASVPAIGSAVAISVSPCGPVGGFRERVLRSLRNVLDGKRAQFPFSHPYLLVLQLGHDQLPPSGLEELLASRIWPNSQYSWLTGVVLFIPPPVRGAAGSKTEMRLSINPAAEHPPSDALIALFEGRQQFHLPR